MLQRRRGIPHLVSANKTSQLSTSKFKEVCCSITNGNYVLRAKVDGAHIKVGKTEDGRVFFASGRSAIPYFKEDIAPHQTYSDTDRSRAYDQIMQECFKCEFVNSIPNDTVVHFEILHPLLGKDTGESITFVTLSYPKSELGVKFTLVPLYAAKYSTQENIKLPKLSDSVVKITSNKLDVQLDSIPEIDEYVNSNFHRAFEHAARIALRSAIADIVKTTKFLGIEPEGVVLETPSVVTKVVSPSFSYLRTLPTNRTAVVAFGSLVGHKGHQQLWDAAIEYARNNQADPFLFISSTVGSDDPISPTVKLNNWQRMYPEFKDQISTVTVDGGSLFSKIKHEIISPSPGLPPRYDRVILFVGSDRASLTMPAALMKSVNKFQGYEHVEVSLVVTNRSTGVTFTNLRNCVNQPEAFETWRNSFDNTISDAIIASMIDTCKELNKVQSD